MTFRRFLLLSMSTLLLAGAWQAKADTNSEQGPPPIRRLFGVELGTRVTEYEALGQGIVEAGLGTPEWIQPIEPPEKNDLFDRYEAIYNPETLEVYQISAKRSMSKAQCRSIIPILYQEIIKKYQGYKILQSEEYVVVDWRRGGYGLFPYQIQCVSDELRIWVFDENARGEHVKNNKNRSPISPSGL
ncbi:hypothetical protein [Ensifer aridi]|uniref:hypothetical protein n=1 Tax=Ensifer aridi TaxID=1708715 RepID=UPI00111BE8FB|nr:hypothetical protein [Ensifer aridi]